MDISDVKTNRILYLAIPINLLLWGSETWALKDSDWKGISYQGYQKVEHWRFANTKVLCDFQILKQFVTLPTAAT